MKKKASSFVVVYGMILIMLSLLTGCIDTYSETDVVAKKAFDLMTTQEKAMHDKVMDGFSQKYLKSIRNDVRKRLVKPEENDAPFIDIANIIKFNNLFTFSLSKIL